MKNKALYDKVESILDNYQATIPLPGLTGGNRKNVLIRQICDSIRRIEFVNTIKNRAIDTNRKNPNHILFDPLRGAILHFQNGDINEAIWLIFLFVHFGKHHKTNYALIKNFYGQLGGGNKWSWVYVINNISKMEPWLITNINNLKNGTGFGNHRKYQSLDPTKKANTFVTIESYIKLIGQDHIAFFNKIPTAIRNNPHTFFDYLYKLFDKNIIGFGRLAIFDFLTMLGKVGIINIEPNSPYIQDATGPKIGTKLLFSLPSSSNKDLNDFLADIANHLNMPFAMQIMEDAVCNWQKSPDNYLYFGG